MTVRSEQWLLKGDCKKCMREKYCLKQCDKHKNHIKSSIKNRFYSLIGKKHIYIDD